MNKQNNEEWENEGGNTLPSQKHDHKLSRMPKHLWGGQTENCIKYFNIGNDYFDEAFISVLVTVKKNMAAANQCFGLIDPEFSTAITQAANYILKENNYSYFPVKIWQTGSGTGINMNVNEVIAAIANDFIKSEKIHPNDHVNMSQSSNDVIPTALNILATKLVVEKLLPTIKALEDELGKKEKEFKSIIKVGRTHLMDAVPMSLGQEFSAFKYQIKENRDRLKSVIERLKCIPLGGTAIGTGLNCPSEVSDYAINKLSGDYDIQFKKMSNLFSGISSSDSIVELSGHLKTLACTLLKMATDIILLSSGPNTGINEFILPNNEAGSSIMPGKENPTQCEALSMVCCQVMGNDTAITLGGMQGRLQLNTFRPLLIRNILHSINLLTDAINSFNSNCLKGLTINQENIERHRNNTKMSITILSTLIGYDKAAALVGNANKNHTSLIAEIDKSEIPMKDEVKKKLNSSFPIHPPAVKRIF